MWNNQLKIALATKDVEKIDTLVKTMPQFEDLKDMEEAFYLMNQARDFLESLKSDTLHSMNKMKKNINFIKSGITFHK